MPRTLNKPGINFWLLWMLATATGWAAAFAIQKIFEDQMLAALAWGTVVYGLLIFAIFMGNGLVIGLLQWLVLRAHMPRSGWWILAAAPGWALSWALVFALPWAFVLTSDPPPFSWFVWLGGLAGGLAGGAAQWLVLQGSVRKAWRWVVFSMAYTPAAYFAFYGVELAERFLGVTTRVVAGGFAAGALSGLGLLWLLRDAAADSTELEDTRPSFSSPDFQ